MKTIKLLAAAALVLLAGCEQMPTIDKEYNPVVIDAALSSVVGTFKQGDAVTGAKITLAYSKGLGRRATILVPEVNGIKGEPFEVTLAEEGGTVEIALTGTPLKRDKMTLRPTIKTSTHEVFITFDVTPEADLILDAATTTVTGTFKIGRPVTDGVIEVAYSSTQPQTVTVSVADVVGVSAAAREVNLPAAPTGAKVNVALTGTPTNIGSQNFVVRMVKEGVEYTLTKAIVISGELTMSGIASGDFLLNVPLTDAMITIRYDADRAMTVNATVPPVDGISFAGRPIALQAGEHTIAIPLAGTPTNEGEKNIVVNFEENNITYSTTVAVKVESDPIEFVAETVTFEGLEYQTVFVDINGNGYISTGEVWLDRNMGATSNDSGNYGADTSNDASYGNYYQWGKPYGTTVYDATYTIDYGTTNPWSTVCPPDYEVPTMAQWTTAIAKLTGGTIDGNNVTGVEGITEKLMASPLGLPMSGWYANSERTFENGGTQGTYWTSSEGSNTAPWRIQLNNNEATATGGGWADRAWQIPVRCIKTVR